MTRSFVTQWCVTWLIDTWHNSLLRDTTHWYAMRLVHMCAESHVNEARHKWMSHIISQCVVSLVNESNHTLLSHEWTSQVTHYWVTNERVKSHITESWCVIWLIDKWHDALTYYITHSFVTRLVHMWLSAHCVIWLVHSWLSDMWFDS